MTAHEYNHVFLPQINRAEEFVELFQTRGWSEETRQVILTALEYYKCAEGLAKIRG